MSPDIYLWIAASIVAILIVGIDIYNIKEGSEKKLDNDD